MMMTDKLKKYVLPYLPYAFIFWFCAKLGTAYRLAEGVDFLRKLTGMARTLNAAFADLLPSLFPFDLFVGVAGAILIYLVVQHRKRNAKKWRKDAEYGSARWGAYYQRKTKFY